MKTRAKIPFRILWVTDPWDRMDQPRDTSLRLAEESLNLGHENYWCNGRSVCLIEGQTKLQAQRILKIEPARTRESFLREPAQSYSPDFFSSIQYRTDPPVDLAYLHPLQLLVLGIQGKKRGPEIVNPPEVIFAQSEKLFALPLKSIFPKSCVSSQWDTLRDFGRIQGKTVLKPLHQAQSKGVSLLEWAPETEGACQLILERATSGFTCPVLLQEYLAGISEGEQRLWFLDGTLIAVARKLPLEGDFRVNIDRGSGLVATKLNPREKKAVPLLSKFLKTHKIRLAAIDLIEGFVTDFNFTSPGLITQMEKITGENLARKIMQRLEKRAHF